MFDIKLKDIHSLYETIKRMAVDSFARADNENAVKYVYLSAVIGYQFNYIYADRELDELLVSIGEKLSPIDCNTPQDGPHRIVLIDGFASSKVLAVQYIRALIAMNVDFLFIAERRSSEMQPYYDEITSSEFGRIYYVNSQTYVERSIELINVLNEFGPSHIITHIEPWETSALVAISCFQNAKKYNINLTDHTFGLGASIFNYSLEFREFGAKISFEKRDFTTEQILFSPYYPLIKKSDFQGFPPQVKDKVILFSGGAYYKIYGDNNRFLHIMLVILRDNPNAIILFAGMGPEKQMLVSFIEKNGLKDRLILLGERSDIDQVFRHSDIYLGTYPTIGGLMSLYAAYFSKPILSFTKDMNSGELPEDIIFTNAAYGKVCSFDKMDDFLSEAQKLISDQIYRENRGRILQRYLVTEKKFVDNLARNLFKPQLMYSYKTSPHIDYDKITTRYIELYNLKANFHMDVILIKNMKFNIFRLHPKFWFQVVRTGLTLFPSFIYKKIYKKNA